MPFFQLAALLVGHSECRALFGETNEAVAQKFVAAIDQGLIPVLCVGETLDERRAGITNSVVTTQIIAVIKHAGIEKLTRGVIAYEPIWAIGTGETASPEQAQAVHRHVRREIGVYDEQQPSVFRFSTAVASKQITHKPFSPSPTLTVV